MSLFGGIEAGGTKFVCGVGTNRGDLIDKFRFETTTPTETVDKLIEYFEKQNKRGEMLAIGIGSFGPVDLKKGSPTYGYITSTPKIKWQNTNFYGKIKGAFDVPVGFDTDVNAAALGEQKWGAAQDISDFIYITIGTGIGGGGIINGEFLHGLVHPEMGHIFIPHDKKADPYEGICPFHKNCFEGLASGSAIKDRWGRPGEKLDKDHPAWDLEAKYISLAVINYICTLSPRKIILGGGVMKQKQLLPLIHKRVKFLVNNYIKVPEITNNIEEYMVLPKLGDNAGVLGAIALAEREYEKRK
ncbi:ROK family protein [candidate division WOR-3 bacterium]|nr:ROK family protein [candidate division WOR-3 bacterium]